MQNDVKPDLFHRTPIMESPVINRRAGRRVLFKMECYQPSGSFKIRGISHLMASRISEGHTQFVCSSGGNAGLAVAYCAAQLNVRATIVVPETTAESVRELLAAYGARVLISGRVWDEADKEARRICSVEHAAYVPPFDDPLLWEGHSTLIDEAAEQIERPDAVVLSVGGGGLLCGVLQGMTRNGWRDVPVVAVETEGAASFAAALQAGRPVALDEITSIAKCLGALQVADEAFRLASRHHVHSVVLSDEDAIRGCLAMADDLRVCVEPACGVNLAAVEQGCGPLDKCATVLVIACGGNAISAEMLGNWRASLS